MYCSSVCVCVCVCVCVYTPPYDILGNTKPPVTMETPVDLLTVKAETEGVCVCVCVQCGWVSVCVCVCYIDFMTNQTAAAHRRLSVLSVCYCAFSLHNLYS